MHVRAYAKNIFKGSRLSAAVFRCGSDRDKVGERTFTPQLVLVFIYSIFNNVLFLTSNWHSLCQIVKNSKVLISELFFCWSLKFLIYLHVWSKMTHFWEFSNSGLNLSIFHFFKQNLNPVFIFTTFFVKKYACVSISYFLVTSKIFLKADGCRPRFSVRQRPPGD